MHEVFCPVCRLCALPRSAEHAYMLLGCVTLSCMLFKPAASVCRLLSLSALCTRSTPVVSCASRSADHGGVLRHAVFGLHPCMLLGVELIACLHCCACVHACCLHAWFTAVARQQQPACRACWLAALMPHSELVLHTDAPIQRDALQERAFQPLAPACFTCDADVHTE